jgi:hypothetical protein
MQDWKRVQREIMLYDSAQNALFYFYRMRVHRSGFGNSTVPSQAIKQRILNYF